MNRAAKFGVPLVFFCVAGLYGLQQVRYLRAEQLLSPAVPR